MLWHGHVSRYEKARPEGSGPPDSVELADADGHVASLPLSHYGAIRRPLRANILRRGDMERKAFKTLFEYVMQSYTLPLSDFQQATPALDLARLRSVRLVFDRAPAGTVVLDEVGFTTADERYRGLARTP